MIASIAALLGVIGMLLWARQEAKVDYAPPVSGIRPVVYQRLERALRALFHGSREVRFTIFAQDPSSSDALRPIARLGWGRAAVHCQVRFRKGEGLAGMAWADPKSIVVADLSGFTSVQRARDAQQQILHLRPETAEALSDDQLRARVLIAAAMEFGQWFRGVLCIDCLDPKLVPGQDNKEFWLGIEKLAAALAPLIPAIEEPRVAMREVNSMKGATLRQVSFEAVEV